LIQYGYFKASGKFFTSKSFKSADIKFASKILKVTAPSDFLEKYTDRMHQKHRLLILNLCGHVDFWSAIQFFDEAVSDMVDKQMHPRKLFYILIEQLRQKKIELPSYDRITRTITEKFHGFEKNILQILAENITATQQEALDQLIATPEKHYERSLLTQLKIITQSLEPRKIKKGIHNFLIIKKIHQEINLVIEKLALSTEATKYYAQWVSKAKTTQISEITEPHKQHFHLIAFIDHSYKIWQDTLIDVLLKSVQQQLNKAKRVVGQMLMDRLPEKNQLTTSVLSGLDDSQRTVNAVRIIVHDPELSNDDKILKLYQLVPCQKKDKPQIKIDLDVEKLKRQIESEKIQSDDFDALSNLSKKLQNRVSDIVKYLKFEAANGAEDLYFAIEHYQSTKNITSTAPDAFLDDNEYAAIHRNEKFNVSLYKAILVSSPYRRVEPTN
jgi:hypothetical protein